MKGSKLLVLWIFPFFFFLASIQSHLVPSQSLKEHDSLSFAYDSEMLYYSLSGQTAVLFSVLSCFGSLLLFSEKRGTETH